VRIDQVDRRWSSFATEWKLSIVNLHRGASWGPEAAQEESLTLDAVKRRATSGVAGSPARRL
jgi:hypothetical protein